jgi:hypothetical protein
MDIVTGEMKLSIWYDHTKNKFSLSVYTGRICSILNSDVITGIQIGEVSKPGLLIARSSRDMWVDSFYLLYVVFVSICNAFPSVQLILWPSSYACSANSDFSSSLYVKLYLCSLMRTSKRLLVTLYSICHNYMTLFLLLGISNRSSFNHCPTEYIFIFENCLEINN